MSEMVQAALRERLEELFGAGTRVARAALLGGGASMEAWAVDAETPRGPLPLLLRRAAGGRIYSEALSLAQEFRVLQAAWEAGVLVPRPYRHFPDVAGREAFLMERLPGETVGRRIVQKPELAEARAALPGQMAEQLPAIELGLLRLRRDLPRNGRRSVCHGDFRIGNLLVGAAGLTGVLDWEFAHVGDPREDLAWPLVRAWRFGREQLRLGGLAQPDAFLDRYAQLTGLRVSLEELRVFELLGNVRWAVGALTQARRHLSGEERSVELAILGRLGAEVEHELLSLLGEGGA